ncbi:hypothetical protein CBS101457_006349 [Exobasidium rhododendri]|nr:hypothetical protein CBS101457_006349 [Exobasidium rhododendri]
MSSPIRPRMGSRAISELNPLITPKHASRDLGRGTHAVSGGAKVISGGRTALGGIAPLSPFLPLPTAPTVVELTGRFSEDIEDMENHQTSKISTSFIRRGPNVNLEKERSMKKSKPPVSTAAHMIRCYSMPVATQADYEGQRRAKMQQRIPLQTSFAANQRCESGWPTPIAQDVAAGRPNAMVSSVSSMGAPKPKTYNRDSTPKNSAHAQLRTPLSVLTLNEEATRKDANMDVEPGSGSDEAEIITPRAFSPRNDYFDLPSDKDVMASHFNDLEDFVHPDHLRPPPIFSL